MKSNLQYLVFQEESANRQIKVENRRIQTDNGDSSLFDKHKIKPQQRMDDIEVLEVEDIEVLEEQKWNIQKGAFCFPASGVIGGAWPYKCIKFFLKIGVPS